MKIIGLVMIISVLRLYLMLDAAIDIYLEGMAADTELEYFNLTIEEGDALTSYNRGRGCSYILQ